jgi:prolyl-tRNA synthetase
MNIVRKKWIGLGAGSTYAKLSNLLNWQESGRWEVYGDEMFRLKDRHKRSFALGPTHEEIITTLVNQDVHSYRDLPCSCIKFRINTGMKSDRALA